jgi:hypothetical protein
MIPRTVITTMLERQAAWQRGRVSLSWEEKLRQSLIMREAQRSLRADGVHPRPDTEPWVPTVGVPSR